MSKFRSWHWYALFIVPLFVGYAACHIYGYSVGEWIFAIAFAASFGSVLATEITFWQLRHRRGGIVQELIDELLGSPAGRKLVRSVERISKFVDEGKLDESLQRISGMTNDLSHFWSENRDTILADSKALVEFIHEFAERYRKAKKKKL